MRIVFTFCICIYVLVDDGQLHYLVVFYLHPVQACKSKNCKSHHVQLELQKPAASRPYISSSSKGAGASEAGGQTKEGPLSKRYFLTSKIAQNRTKSPVPIVIDVFGVTAPYGNPDGSKIAIL